MRIGDILDTVDTLDTGTSMGTEDITTRTDRMAVTVATGK